MGAVKLRSQRTIRSIAHWLALVLTLAAASAAVQASDTIIVSENEAGRHLGAGLRLWHDPSGEASLTDAAAALAGGKFEPLSGSGTGLQPGAFWGAFRLTNPGQEAVELRLEYIDHQLLYLTAYAQVGSEASAAIAAPYAQIANLAMEAPFSSRPVQHHRLVIPLRIEAGDSVNLMVRYGSHESGFVFPDLRIWSPAALVSAQSKETLLVSVIVGGLAVMGLFALIGGVATGSRSFLIYSLHAMASIAVWFTVLGFTHQYLLTEHFRWNYMSITGALSLMTGIWFARTFLGTAKHTPRLDYLLLFQLLNSVFLLFAAVTGQKTLAVVSITLALLLYPSVSIIGFKRWLQGAREAALFTLAWSFLVVGLFGQALRDLGLVEHNLVNYYWPAIASYSEMAVILVAMGIRIRDLRATKEKAERAIVEQLRASKAELEAQVAERTRDLVAAKTAAEIEARTDTLTGVNNRRSFLEQGQAMLERSRRNKLDFNLVMLDIDHFKVVNDEHGHETGDRALVAIAEAVMTLVRDRDLFGRLGGEEFALAVISSPDSAQQLAQRLRGCIHELQLETASGPVQLTASIGVATLTGEETIEQLLRRADVAMYDAKRAGRDRVVAA
ncbi:MAG: diguanylate cyclase [Pseudomonadota bacterium]